MNIYDFFSDTHYFESDQVLFSIDINRKTGPHRISALYTKSSMNEVCSNQVTPCRKVENENEVRSFVD